MSILTLIVILAAIGVIMWLINAYLPIQEPFKKILNVIVIILVVLWLVSLFVPLGELGRIRTHP